jgi:hypothetical protein
MKSHTNIPIADIKKLVEYLWHDEQKDFHATDNPPRNHIFRAVRRVDEWLDDRFPKNAANKPM